MNLLHIICFFLKNLLFIPDFTVAPHKKNLSVWKNLKNLSNFQNYKLIIVSFKNDEIKTIDSCEYIWEAGVGFSHSPPQNFNHDYNRTEILKLLLTTFSEAMYTPPNSMWTKKSILFNKSVKIKSFLLFKSSNTYSQTCG
jgi:hypothetical protein